MLRKIFLTVLGGLPNPPSGFVYLFGLLSGSQVLTGRTDGQPLTGIAP